MMKLKFCGFTSIKDVTAASQLPIDAIGFIHYEKSKRHQTITQIKKLASAVPNHNSYTAQNLLILYRKLKRNIQALKSLKL